MPKPRTRAPLADRQAIWTAIRGMHAESDCAISAPGIRRRMPGACPLGRIRDYLHALAAAGILLPVPSESTAPVAMPAYYYLADDRGSEAPRIRADGSEIPPTTRERIWTALRVAGSATLAEIRASVQTDAERVPIATVEDYLARLERARIVVSIPAGRREARRYHLPRVANTGPLAPVVRNGRHRTDSTVADPNTGLVYRADGSGETVEGEQ
jgi:hypothetical protein